MTCFDVDTGLTRDQFKSQYPEWWSLCEAISRDEDIPYDRFKNLPGITPEKLKVLHDKHKQARSKQD